MKKVTIINKINGREFGAKFEDDQKMQEWIDSCIAKNSWGKPEREISDEMISFEDKARALSSIIRGGVKYHKVPSDYSI